MRRSKISLLAVISLVAVVWSCGWMPFQGKISVFGWGDNGKMISLRAGQKFDIVLEGNPTTGYTWEVMPGRSGIIRRSGEPLFVSDSKMVGSGGKYTFHFKAVKQGKEPLKLVYSRPWEHDIPPVKTYRINCIVK